MITNDVFLENTDEYEAVLDYKGNSYNTINVLLSDNITMREQEEDLRKLLPKTEKDFKSIIETIVNLYSAIKKNYILNGNKSYSKKLFRGGRIGKMDNSFISTSDDIEVALKFADYFDKTNDDGQLLIIDSKNVPYMNINKIIPDNDTLSRESETLFLPCEVEHLEEISLENLNEIAELTEEQMSELRKFRSLKCAKAELKEIEYSRDESSLSESDLCNMFSEYKRNLYLIREIDEDSEKYDKAYQQILQFKKIFGTYIRQRFYDINQNIGEQTNTKSDNISLSSEIDIKEVSIGNTGRMYHVFDKQSNEEYYFKPAVSKNGSNRLYRAYIQEVAYYIQKIINPENAVKCNVTELDGMFGAIQEKITIDDKATQRFRRYFNDGIGELSPEIINQILDEYLVDFCLCNYDSHSKNFIIDQNGKLRGIDKEQSLRYIKEDRNKDMMFSANYNEEYGENPPIYSILFSKMKDGEISYKYLNENGEVVYRHLQELRYKASRLSQYPDEQYRKIFEQYAYSKAKTSKEAEILLDSIVDRKKDILSIIEQLYYNVEKKEKIISMNEVVSDAITQGISKEDAMLKGNYVSLTPNLYDSRIIADSSECSSTSGTYKVEGSNIIWCSQSRDNDEYLCDWDATPSSKGSFMSGFTNYRYAVYYSPKEDTACISPAEYEEELIGIMGEVKEHNIKSDEQIRRMVANAVSKKQGANAEHVICSITNDKELESLERILASSDVDTFIKGYVSMFSGLEFLQSEISREAPEGIEVARNFEVDSLAIFDSECVNIDRIMNYQTREDVSFNSLSDLSGLIERDELEDEQIRRELEERRKSANDILKNVKLPSPVSTEDYTNDTEDDGYDYSTFYDNLWNADIDETIEGETIGDINAEINEIKDEMLNRDINDKEEPRR